MTDEQGAPAATPPAPHEPDRARPRRGWRALVATLAGRLTPGVALAAVGGVLAVSAASVGIVLAASPATGHDVSYPQCGRALPTTGSFGIVGVNGGRVSSFNSCFAGQYAWAARFSGGASIYANTGNPGSISTFYWPASGARDPALCQDRTSPADPGCAYDYGWHGAADSLRLARNAVGAVATSRTWWLDVETANSWNGTPAANAAALQGAIDQLRGAGVPTVGLYSTSYQWGQITGGYARSNAATYKAGWAPYFTPRFPMEDAPNWLAYLGSRDAAAGMCGQTFTGATAMLVQYNDGGIDGDVMCGGLPAPPGPTPTTTTTTKPPTSSTTTTSRAPTSTTGPTGTTTTTTTTPPPTTTTTTTTAAPGTAPSTSPTALTAVPGDATVALSWTPPAALPPGATYTVTRSGPGTTPPAVVARGLTTPTWTDRAVTNGAAYAYTVAAATPAGTGPATPPVTVTPSATPGPATSVVAAPAATKGVTLTWAAPVGTGAAPVIAYLVQRSDVPGRETTVAISNCRTTTCAYTDAAAPAGRTAWYRLIAVNGRGVQGTPSPEVSAVAR